MNTKTTQLLLAVERHEPGHWSKKAPATKGAPPPDAGLLMDANVGIDGGCVQPGGAEDARPDTGASCQDSMDGG